MHNGAKLQTIGNKYVDDELHIYIYMKKEHICGRKDDTYVYENGSYMQTKEKHICIRKENTYVDERKTHV